MTTIRVVRSDDLTTVVNQAINDYTLSFAARGMLIRLLSYQNETIIPIRDLTTNTIDSYPVCMAILKELGTAGYLIKHLTTDPIHYTIHATPIHDPQAIKRARYADTRFQERATIHAGSGVTSLRPEHLMEIIGHYPVHRRTTDAEAIADAWNRCVADGNLPTVRAIVADIEQRKEGYDWTKEGGRFIPKLIKYLDERMWTHPILPAPDDQRPKRDADWNSASRGGVVL